MRIAKNSHPKVLHADEATTNLGDTTAHSKNLIYLTSCHLVISTTNDKDFCRFETPPWDTYAVAEVRVVKSKPTYDLILHFLPDFGLLQAPKWTRMLPNFLVAVKGNRFVTVYLTRAEFSSSYPTFDDDLKLSAEHWVCSFVPDFLFGRKPLQPPNPNC